jgi:hypothetical protein
MKDLVRVCIMTLKVGLGTIPAPCFRRFQSSRGSADIRRYQHLYLQQRDYGDILRKIYLKCKVKLRVIG